MDDQVKEEVEFRAGRALNDAVKECLFFADEKYRSILKGRGSNYFPDGFTKFEGEYMQLCKSIDALVKEFMNQQ
ncbi:MAG: hypothetical protein A2413_08525 [Treponema sp. RIFOXYC1_FULL_61_9]|nr:MAG: hypothetical protein A2001_03595 [Treponema sp. GWC1_61_84]OHE71802.1 MAG: hypothetical protein A2413_08525 [Treponema sp. RIFOXYC1_FULL_61_9]